MTIALTGMDHCKKCKVPVSNLQKHLMRNRCKAVLARRQRDR